MEQSDLERLTEEERRALVAYGEEGSRKGAARLLGKSESTIATQLASARDKLGATSTSAAVKLLRVHSERTNPPRTMVEPASLPPDRRAEQPMPIEAAVREVGVAYQPHPSSSAADRVKREKPLNSLSITHRLLAIVTIMALVMIALAVAPLVAEGVQRWAFTAAHHN